MARWSSQSTHQDLSQFSDNPHLRKELAVRRRKILIAVSIATVVIGLSARPVYRAVRTNMIDRNLEQAARAARLEDWATARNKARSVLLAREGDFEAYRVWTRALGKMGEARTYLAAARLFTDDRATRDDRLESLQVMGRQAPQAVALSAYASLEESERDDVEFRAAITPLLVMRGEIDIAERGLREVLDASRPPGALLELLRTLCARPEPERVAEAREIFVELIAAADADPALEALLILGETPGGLAPGAPLPDLPAWLRGEPRAKTLHHLLALHPQIESSPAAANRAIASAIQAFTDTDPGVLGTWLVRHNRPDRALKLLEEPAKTRSDAYLARLNAMLRIDDEEALRGALAKPPDSADLVEWEIVRAVMAQRRKDQVAAAAAWTRALNHAAFDGTRNRFIDVARVAEGHGATTAAEDAWVAAVRSGWGQIPLYRDLIPVFGRLAAKGRSGDLLAMYGTLIRFEPHNPELINNFYYLALIHGLVPPDQVATALTVLVESHPEVPAFNSALMLAELIGGRVDEALARMPALRESKRVAPMMAAALEGSARVMAGEADAGRDLLRQVNWRLFMRQERIAFRRLLVKFEAADLPLPEMESPAATYDAESLPSWRRAVEKLEKERAGDVLPALPPLRIPGSEPVGTNG